MISAALRSLPQHVYNAKNLDYNPALAKAAVVTLALVTGATLYLSEDQKKEAAKAWIQFQRNQFNLTHISDQELLDNGLQSMRSAFNVTASSPAFYGLYQAIHKSGLPIQHHLGQAALKGLNGTLNVMPIIAVFYVAADLAISKFQDTKLAKGYGPEVALEDVPKKALGDAQAKAFLSGGPIEFALEAFASGVKPNQLQFGPSVLAIALLTGRLATGALTQYQAAGKKDEKLTPEQEQQRKLESYCKTVVGTTFTQHGVNGIMQTLTKEHGWKGFANYLSTGSTVGKGFGDYLASKGVSPKWTYLNQTTMKGAVGQFGATLGQRALYTAFWNTLSHRKQETPSWAIATPPVKA